MKSFQLLSNFWGTVQGAVKSPEPFIIFSAAGYHAQKSEFKRGINPVIKNNLFIKLFGGK